MALINCPDCDAEVSSAALACPKCARPNPGLPTQDPDGQAQTGTTELQPPETPRKKSKSSKFQSIALVLAVVCLAAFGILYYVDQASREQQSSSGGAGSTNPISVVSTRSTSPIIGAPTVHAVIHNSGSPTRVHVLVRGSGSWGTACGEFAYLGHNERRQIDISCPHLFTFSSSYEVDAVATN